jgi:hypothetical protein
VPVPSVLKRFRFHLLPLSFTSCRGAQTDVFIPSVAEAKNEWRYTSTATICLHDVERENFTLFLMDVFSFNGTFFCFMRSAATNVYEVNLVMAFFTR